MQPSTVLARTARLVGPSALGPAMLALQPPLGMAMRFDIVIGTMSLGSWSSCRGIQVDFKPTRFRELGTNGYRRVLMPDIEYATITLERAMDGRSSAVVQQWLTTQAKLWLAGTATGAPYSGETGRITLYNTHALPVANWTVYGVYPSKWTGPTLSGKDTGIAIESLELAHEGFLDVSV
jgi:phage tail-like protein